MSQLLSGLLQTSSSPWLLTIPVNTQLQLMPSTIKSRMCSYAVHASFQSVPLLPIPRIKSCHVPGVKISFTKSVQTERRLQQTGGKAPGTAHLVSLAPMHPPCLTQMPLYSPLSYLIVTRVSNYKDKPHLPALKTLAVHLRELS